MSQGTILGGKYRLTQRIGRGAMGQVWAAIHTGLSRHVAIKLMVASHPELKLRLLREAQACGRLKHPNIVEVLDVGETPEGDPYLVMELLSGQTLGQYIKSKFRLDQAEAARIGRDITKALAVAHAAGIIHRDIKPANIFLHEADDGDGGTNTVVKVVDFGVAKNLEGEADGMTTKTGGMIGSPAYMSPEQVQGKRDIDARSDLWAVGVVLFEMLTGKRPFEGTEEQIQIKILVEQAPLVSARVRSVSPGLVQLVARCMERDREQRIETAQQLVEMLLPFCDASVKLPAHDGAASGPASQAAAEPPRSLAFAPLSVGQLPSVANVTGDDDDHAQTARLEPGMLRNVQGGRPPAPAPAPASLPIQPPRQPARQAVGASGTLPLDTPLRLPPESASGTMPLDKLGHAQAPLMSGGTLPLDPAWQAQVQAARDQAAQQAPSSVAFGRQPQPSSGEHLARGVGGTMRMDPLGSLLPAAPQPVPPAPPPPSAQQQPSVMLGSQAAGPPPSSSGSGSWPAQTSPFAPASQRAGAPISGPTFGPPPPDAPGATSTTAQLVPARPVSAGEIAPAVDPAQQRRRKIGVGVAAGVLLTAFAILTTVVLGKLVGHDAGKTTTANAPASASTAVAAVEASAAPSAEPVPSASADPAPEASATAEPKVPVKVAGPMPGAGGKKAPPSKPNGKAPPKGGGKKTTFSPGGL